MLSCFWELIIMWIIQRIIFILVLCCCFSCEAMDLPLKNFSEQEEKIPLISQEEIPQTKKFSEKAQGVFPISNRSIAYEDYLFHDNKDIWTKIILRVCDPRDLCRLAQVSKSICKIFYKDKPIKSLMMLLRINY